MPKSSVGRVVHFVGSASNRRGEGVCRAAIVIASKDDGSVGLCVFNPQTVLFKHNVKLDEAKASGTWHWPELVGDPSPADQVGAAEP